MKSVDYMQRYAAAPGRVVRAVPEADHVFQHEGRNLELYHGNGLSALRAIVLAMLQHDQDMPASIMDFGCAHGRVLRYLAAGFPEAALSACDTRQDALEYCAATFGAQPVPSSSTLAEISFPRTHDLIWAGSVITHFSAGDARLLVGKLLENLNPNGLLVFTVHGRIYPQRIQPELWKITDDASFSAMLQDYHATGYGYRDYPGRQGIGASLTTPGWLHDLVKADRNLTFSYTERGWMSWQDVCAIRRGEAREYFSRYKDQAY